MLEMSRGNSNAYAYFLNRFIKLGSKHKEVAFMLVGINIVSCAVLKKITVRVHVKQQTPKSLSHNTDICVLGKELAVYGETKQIEEAHGPKA